MRRLFALPALLAAAAVLAPSALAHANLVSTSPKDSAILGTAPTDVRIRFDDSVSAGPGNAVVANGGGSVLAGRPQVVEDGRELVLPLKQLEDGDYSVRWRIVSDDGHLEEGVLAFRVGSGRPSAGAPKPVLAAGSIRPSLGDLLSRWLYLGGILVAGGTALFRLLVFRIGALRSAQTFMLSLSAAALGGSWLLYLAHAGDTRFARVTTVSVVIAAGGAAAAAVSTRYPRLLVVAGAASLALLVAPSLAGHALDPNGARIFSFAADLVHVVAAAFWIGGLVQLALLLRAGEDTGPVRRFSRLALPAVVLIALAGGGRALVELSAVSQLWSTGYGQTIVVKSALLAALVVLAWLSRGRLDSVARMLRSASTELALLAVVVGAVALLTALRPGRDEAAARRPIVPAEAARPALPPRGAVVLARESRELAVALAVRPGRPLGLTATIIGQTGRGVDGLDVELVAARERSGASNPAQSCGHGCYSTTLAFANPTRFAVNISGRGRFRSVAFPLPGPWPPARGTAFLRRASQTFRALDSVVFLERLASGPRRSILTTWKLEAPNRVEYAIHGGAGGIVIGSTRWDRVAAGAPWKSSQASPLVEPVPFWGSRIADAHVLHQTPGRVTVSWLDPGVPAWFTGTFDRGTAHPVEVRMTAAAHFMLHRYLAFNGDVRIRPPG